MRITGPERSGQLFLDPSGSLVVQEEGNTQSAVIFKCDMQTANVRALIGHGLTYLHGRLVIIQIPGSEDKDPVSYAIKPSEESQAAALVEALGRLK
eukprot:scaffold156962_cov50-Prasinocladus_malaysianus.AAC.1